MKNITLLFFALYLFLPVHAQTGESVAVTTDGIRISGTLLLPEPSSGKIPLVIIIAGSGPTDRDGNNPMMKPNTYRMLAEGLAANGIASLRYDKRGIGESAYDDLDESKIVFEDFLDDLRAWIDRLSTDDRFSEIIVAGHSEGALLGLLASIDNPAVTKYISIAGTGRPGDEILKEQLAAQPDEIRSLCYPIIDRLKKGDKDPYVNPMLYSLFCPSVQPFLISWFRYDPVAEIGKLRIPILIIQGDKDIQVSLHDSQLLTASAFEAEELIVTNMNHILKPVITTDIADQMDSYSNPDLPLVPGLVDSVTEFILR